jgi:hypothetical protein
VVASLIQGIFDQCRAPVRPWGRFRICRARTLTAWFIRRCEILDFWHAMEHAREFARMRYGDGSQQADQWVRQIGVDLKAGKVEERRLHRLANSRLVVPSLLRTGDFSYEVRQLIYGRESREFRVLFTIDGSTVIHPPRAARESYAPFKTILISAVRYCAKERHNIVNLVIGERGFVSGMRRKRRTHFQISPIFLR